MKLFLQHARALGWPPKSAELEAAAWQPAVPAGAQGAVSLTRSSACWSYQQEFCRGTQGSQLRLMLAKQIGLSITSAFQVDFRRRGIVC